MSVVRGSTGSPVTATTLPTVSIGNFTAHAATEGRTRSLSGLGVSLPEFVSPQVMDDALCAVHNDLERKLTGAIRGVEANVRDLEPNVERRVRDIVMT